MTWARGHAFRATNEESGKERRAGALGDSSGASSATVARTAPISLGRDTAGWRKEVSMRETQKREQVGTDLPALTPQLGDGTGT